MRDPIFMVLQQWRERGRERERAEGYDING
jgi:hypothetical protein